MLGSPREEQFPDGFGCYVRIREIIHRAKRSLLIIDPYLDGTVFTILADIQGTLTVKLFAAKIPADFALETAKFQQQHPQVQVETRRSRDFHDRFIVIDETECWHIGCSIKDAGKKAFMLSAIKDSRNSEALLETLRHTWANAKSLV